MPDTKTTNAAMTEKPNSVCKWCHKTKELHTLVNGLRDEDYANGKPHPPVGHVLEPEAVAEPAAPSASPHRLACSWWQTEICNCDAAPQPVAGVAAEVEFNLLENELENEMTKTDRRYEILERQKALFAELRRTPVAGEGPGAWRKLPVGHWFFLDSLICTNRYSVHERTDSGCTLICSTPWHHDGAKTDMQRIADLHNSRLAEGTPKLEEIARQWIDKNIPLQFEGSKTEEIGTTNLMKDQLVDLLTEFGNDLRPFITPAYSPACEYGCSENQANTRCKIHLPKVLEGFTGTLPGIPPACAPPLDHMFANRFDENWTQEHENYLLDKIAARQHESNCKICKMATPASTGEAQCLCDEDSTNGNLYCPKCGRPRCKCAYDPENGHPWCAVHKQGNSTSVPQAEPPK